MYCAVSLSPVPAGPLARAPCLAAPSPPTSVLPDAGLPAAVAAPDAGLPLAVRAVADARPSVPRQAPCSGVAASASAAAEHGPLLAAAAHGPPLAAAAASFPWLAWRPVGMASRQRIAVPARLVAAVRDAMRPRFARLRGPASKRAGPAARNSSLAVLPPVLAP